MPSKLSLPISASGVSAPAHPLPARHKWLWLVGTTSIAALLSGCGGSGASTASASESTNTNALSSNGVFAGAGAASTPASAVVGSAGAVKAPSDPADVDSAASKTEVPQTGASGSAAATVPNGTNLAAAAVATNAASLPADLGALWSLGAETLVAGFDASVSDSVHKWTYLNGVEFPGASGSVQEVAGKVSGRAAKLSYNFSCGGDVWTALAGRQCGRYVAMNLAKFPSSVSVGSGDTPTISFDWRNLQSTATPSLRIVDGTGQTLQFSVPTRSLENVDGKNWQKALIPVASSSIFWGGANDGKLHPPIASMMIMAGNVALPSPAGDVEVDNITYHKNPDSSFELMVGAPLAQTSVASSYFGGLGIAWRPITGFGALEKAMAVGVTIARLDLHWDAVEVSGKFNFSYYQSLASELLKRNVRIVWVLDYGHKDHGGKVPLTTADQAAYAEFAKRTAQTFKGYSNLIGYEIWNEPNWQPFWPNPDPVAYSKLLGVTIDAIRSVDNVSKISTGGVADIDFDYLMKVLRSGKASKINAIGLHPYRKLAPETFAGQVSTLKQMAGAVGLSAELWDTEWGYSTYGDVGDVSVVGDGHDARSLRRQAVLTVRKVLTAASLNLPLSVLYDMVDDGTNPKDREHNFGLLNNDQTEKPAYVGLRTLYTAQSGRILKGLLSNVPPGLHAMRWDGVSDKVFAVWSDATAGQRVKVTLPAGTSKVVLWNGTTPATLVGKQLYVQESDGPVFVTVSN
jgi:hypothetical protein